MRLLIINGPNMEILEHRESKYGGQSLNDLKNYVMEQVNNLPVEIEWFQSSNEGEIISSIHSAMTNKLDGIIINPAAFCHTSVAILDALNAYKGKVIEVHLTNIHTREDFRQVRITAKRANGVIEGFGRDSYVLAVRAMILKEVDNGISNNRFEKRFKS